MLWKVIYNLFIVNISVYCAVEAICFKYLCEIPFDTVKAKVFFLVILKIFQCCLDNALIIASDLNLL